MDEVEPYSDILNAMDILARDVNITYFVTHKAENRSSVNLNILTIELGTTDAIYWSIVIYLENYTLFDFHITCEKYISNKSNYQEYSKYDKYVYVNYSTKAEYEMLEQIFIKIEDSTATSLGSDVWDVLQAALQCDYVK